MLHIVPDPTEADPHNVRAFSFHLIRQDPLR